jgi:hypothetical protein
MAHSFCDLRQLLAFIKIEVATIRQLSSAVDIKRWIFKILACLDCCGGDYCRRHFVCAGSSSCFASSASFTIFVDFIEQMYHYLFWH